MKKITIFAILTILFIGCEKKDTNTSNVNPPLPESNLPEYQDDRPARANRQGRGEIHFYYSETCPTCDDYKLAKDMEVRLRGGAAKGHFPWEQVSVSTTNVLTQENIAELQDLLAQKGLPDVSLSLPLIIVNNELVIGYEEIDILIEGLLNF